MPLELAALLREPRVIFGLACLALALLLLTVLLIGRLRVWLRRRRRPDLRPHGLGARYRAPRPGLRLPRAPRTGGPRPYTGSKRRPPAAPHSASRNHPHHARPSRRGRPAPAVGSALRPYRGGGKRPAPQAGTPIQLGGHRRAAGSARRYGAGRPRSGPGGYHGKPFWRR